MMKMSVGEDDLGMTWEDEDQDNRTDKSLSKLSVYQSNRQNETEVTQGRVPPLPP